jgi:rfaE bifunctional protein nucleotidyltransferase chain/domain
MVEYKSKIVFTNGCFDIIHVGHVEYLRWAKGLGDELIVGLNSDNSVSNLKGPGRPINNFADRAAVLKSIKYVDKVIEFDAPTPIELIMRVKPDILVKGGDYKAEEIVGYEFVTSYGGQVISGVMIENKSTTELISRIQKCHVS